MRNSKIFTVDLQFSMFCHEQHTMKALQAQKAAIYIYIWNASYFILTAYTFAFAFGELCPCTILICIRCFLRRRRRELLSFSPGLIFLLFNIKLWYDNMATAAFHVWIHMSIAETIFNVSDLFKVRTVRYYSRTLKHFMLLFIIWS